ncbi:MAG: HI1450 family dsDNA-mimic protein [Moritella sp.]|uniref:HI1450 family dsDNA-mimic protein n=1 Tax=Moritella sp. TaxID=78556 RepID=UPI0029A60180|nr:HI1450 family dsDNA-mimic protein [Moritella sp.]MDX2320387.1 HI1450 family dsDNA-mimic protein [Moritella sp.]
MLLKTEDELIDFAYDAFLENAQTQLSPADQILFAMQFEDLGAVDIVDLGKDWPASVAMGINDNEYCELHIGLVDDNDLLNDVFGRVLVKKKANDDFIHIIWKTE